MKYSLHYLVACAMAAFLITACNPNKSEKGEKPPTLAVEDFFRNADKSQWRISPDGNYASYLSSHLGHTNVFVQKIGDSTAIPVTMDSLRNIHDYQWKGNRILYLQDIGGDENFQLFSVSIDGKEQKALTPFPKVATSILNDLRYVPGREKEVMVQMNKRDARFFDPYSVNIETGEMKQLYQNDRNFETWFTDHTGVIRLATKTDGVNSTYYYRANESAPFDSLFTTDYKEGFLIHFFNFDSKTFFASSDIGRDKRAVIEYDPVTRKELRVLYQNPEYDADALDFSWKDKKVLSAGFISWKAEKHFLDADAEAADKKLGAKFSGYEYQVVGHNDSEDKQIVWTGNDKVSSRYYFYDKNTGETKYLSEAMPWLKEEHLADMKPIEYKSSDGLTIHGYLTLPKGVDAKNLPVVINPHGGPWARDEWSFNPEVQFLANRGYAVLQMNFRGSTGYGKEFWLKGNKQWGRKMQDDITDGVKYLVKEGIADSTRVAIYGGSYGGYATLAGITLTPDLYRCAVDYVGVSNMFTFMNTIPPYWEPYLDMFYEMVGDPKKDSLMLAEISPAFHADKIKVPLFIAQGRNDPRVNVAESDQMEAALKARGVEVVYMVKNDEGHGFQNENNRLDFYRTMEKFFATHLAPAADPKK